MPSEMLSGPDLGGGFLHQLTTDRDGDRTTFTYHAQDGGQDANGPPRGPLDVFGSVHPPSPCPFGGPRCWHRRFLMAFQDTARVRPCYNRHRFVLQTLIDQTYAGAPIAAEPALLEVIDRLAGPAGPPPEDWWVTGPTAQWVLGNGSAPRSVELRATRTGIDRIGSALTEYLTEPTATTDWPGLGIVRGARAFVGTFAQGARVEWAIPLDVGGADRGPIPGPEPTHPVVRFQGRAVRVETTDRGLPVEP